MSAAGDAGDRGGTRRCGGFSHSVAAGAWRPAAELVFAFAALLATSMSALAATPVTLVSNIDQPDSAQSRAIHAQPFTTGPNSAGYELTSVDVQLGDSVPSAGDIVVEILSHNSGPGSTLATLTNPATLTKQSANTFTVPAGDQLTLDAETTYHVLIYHADDDDGGSTVTVNGVATTRFGIIIDRTNSKSEDSGAATGWSIGNRRYFKVRYDDSWGVSIIRFAKIAIRGTRLLSDDATLSDLSLSHGSITVPLNRAFDAATTQYTASVAYGVSSLTVTPTTNEMNATVGYFDASDTDLDDADANTPRHQVNLERGPNTLKVKVTADDGNTTETYTVVVTREPPTVPEAPEGFGATPVSPTQIYLYWTAPSNFVNSAITGYEYRVSTDDGHSWFRPWRDIPGAGNRADITEHTVHWLDSANEYTFQVRAENALGGGLSASVKARPGKPAVSRPTLTIEKVTGEDNVIAGKRDATRRVQQGSLVNGVFVGNGTYHDSCHEDAIAHYRIRATGGDHLWRPGSRFRGVSVGVEYRRAGRNSERSSAGVSSSVTGLVGRIAGSIIPGNRHWDRKNCIAEQGADRRPLIVRLVPGEGYFVGRPARDLHPRRPRRQRDRRHRNVLPERIGGERRRPAARDGGQRRERERGEREHRLPGEPR